MGQGGAERRGGEDRFSHKVERVLSQKEALGLSEQQVEGIRALGLKVSREMIAGKAEEETAAAEIKNLLAADPVDIEAVNRLIDRKYAAKAAKAKAQVSAEAQLKEKLTPEQREKLRTLRRERMKQMKDRTRHEGRGEREGR
ncbi:MAG: hypothetical protein COV76_04500 [Candidatus Omnitrophica bacterium CG11_big_fil_rev_8_21_14_0_20_64_10]|nr:MAG: hypothetical protein COV76_04500 [Candidatus Omnitrophica bacterium CG11_big_fil_rev_8_21_14_0_20_64_10]